MKSGILKAGDLEYETIHEVVEVMVKSKDASEFSEFCRRTGVDERELAQAIFTWLYKGHLRIQYAEFVRIFPDFFDTYEVEGECAA